jgi:UDP-glucose 4-epimerase
LQVLIAARDALVQRVIYASSLRVYGHAPWEPLSEDAPAYPLSPYSAAKLTGEQDCTAFTHMYGLETVRLRFSNLFGPRQRPSRCAGALAARLATTLLKGQRPVLPGDGSQTQDLLYIDDAVQAAVLAAEAPDVSGQVFNVGRGVAVTPQELAARLCALTGGPPPLLGAPPLPLEFSNRADIARARAKLNFQPRADLDTELLRFLDAYRSGARDPRDRKPTPDDN